MKTWTITITAEDEKEAIKAIKTGLNHFEESIRVRIPVVYMHGGFDDNTVIIIVERK